MKVWFVSFFLLFAMAELYQWLKHFSLPLPVYILGGAFLAIASNYERITGLPWQRTAELSSQAQMPSVISYPYHSQPHNLESQQMRSIAFTLDTPQDGN